MATSECVKVIVRCRPMNQREKDLKCDKDLQITPSRGQCAISNPHDKKAPPKSFTFDGAYDTDSTTENIYNDIAYPLVEGVTEGYNGTIFAYGQTGCGKSFTMQGITDPQTQRGIIPRAFDHIFETVSVAEQTKFLIHASYCEIYNEEIRDLLSKDVRAKLELKEHPERGVYVNGLSMHPVHNVVECEKVMDKGWKNRATGATLMNAESSRSHSIFTINLEMMTPDDAGEEHIRAGKLNLVDLAGSERQAKTGSTGDRLKEATKINLSLSALGNVISALVDGKSKHIPYRDSKLTRLLQDSLGGNTKTLMVACLSPADNNYDETLSTLRYANRAKNIQNKPKINEDPKDALLRQYQEEIQKLKAMLMGQLPIPDGGFDDLQFSASETARGSATPSHAREELEHEKERIREEYDAKLQEMQAEFEKEKVSKARLEQDMSRLRAFYDEKLNKVEGQIEQLPSTAEGQEKAEPPESAGGDENQEKKGGKGGKVAVAAAAGAAVGVAVGKNSESAAKGKVVTKTVVEKKIVNGKEVVVKTEIVEVEKEDAPGAPQSVSGDTLPTGPDDDTADDKTPQSSPREDAESEQSMRLMSMSESGGEVALAAGLVAAGAHMEAGDDGVIIGPDGVPIHGHPGPDGSIITQMVRPDGVVVERTIAADGVVIERSTRKDGTVIERTAQLDGLILQKIIRPDGTVQAEGIVRPDGEFVGPDGTPVPASVTEDAALAGEVAAPGPSGRDKHPAGQEGILAPRSSPTQAPMQEQLRFHQEEAMKRLHELEQQMVGGENIDNIEMKEKRNKRKRFADERKRKLAEAIAKMDDDGIMLDIYDNIQDEVKAKNKLLEKQKEKYESLERDLIDVKSEFEFDRIDYLDTIRKQEKQILLLQEFVDKMHPCIRKDCNYSNLDKVRMESVWNEEDRKWVVPKLSLERTALPVSGTILPGGMAPNGRNSRVTNGDFDHEDDRFREKLMRKQDKSGQYFQNKRPSQLIQSSEPLRKIDMAEIKQSYGIANQVPMTNGYRGAVSDEPISNDLKAAKVHGQIMNDEGITRKPMRLQALPSVGKKSKKKKNMYDAM